MQNLLYHIPSSDLITANQTYTKLLHCFKMLFPRLYVQIENDNYFTSYNLTLMKMEHYFKNIIQFKKVFYKFRLKPIFGKEVLTAFSIIRQV